MNDNSDSKTKVVRKFLNTNSAEHLKALAEMELHDQIAISIPNIASSMGTEHLIYIMRVISGYIYTMHNESFFVSDITTTDLKAQESLNKFLNRHDTNTGK